MTVRASANARTDAKPLFTLNYHNRTLQLTREGGAFIALVFGIGLGAINTGNNLLYLVLAMCCSFIAVSGTLSEMVLKEIEVRGSLPATVYAEEYTPLAVTVTNRKKRFPSFSLRLSFNTPPSPSFETEGELLLLHLPAGQSIEKSILLKAMRRGPLAIIRCTLSTRFPFGFFIKSRRVNPRIETLVFPPIRPVELPDPDSSSLEGEGTLQKTGEELHAINEYIPGDPMNRIHWKSTAKTGSLRVKEFIGGGGQSFSVFLNTRDAQNELIDKDLLEQRISEAASLIYHLIRRGDEVRLTTEDFQSSCDRSEAHLESLLTHLARIGWQETANPHKTPAHV